MEEKTVQAEDEINLLDYLVILLKRKKLILGGTLGFALFVGIIVYMMPDLYEADARFLPPGGTSTSTTTAILSQMGLSGAAGSLLGSSTPGALYVGLLLNSRTIQDKIIDRFGLMERYKPWLNRWLFTFYREDCRKKLTDDVMTAAVDTSSGIVTLSIYEEDPKIAANMANAFVEEMRSQSKGMAISEAAQRRLFYEEQLNDTKVALSRAEDEMRSFQEKTGVIRPDVQAQAVITGDAALRAQIAAKEVEMKVLRTYATSSNPDLQKAEEALQGLKAELAKLEVRGGNGANPLIPTGMMPSEGLEYVRKMRDVTFNQQLYELIMKLYQSAKLDESSDASIIQVVDKAVVPEKKAKPKRLLVIAIALFAGFLLSVFAAFIMEFKEKAVAHPGNSEKVELLRRYSKCWRRN